MKDPVFLVHGFHSDSASMNNLAKVFKVDYLPILVELPITYYSLESALLNLKQSVKNYLKKNQSKNLYFIGHSTGGIIIQMLMKDFNFSSLTKACLFIATPNKGTILADIHQKLPMLIKTIHLPVEDLTKSAISQLRLRKPKNVIYGAIAGSRSIDLTDKFFDSPNDGIVAVNSVFFKELNDFIILPVNHFEIHQNYSICMFSKYFIKNGFFKNEIKEINKMSLGEKFIAIVENGYINELCAQIRGNITFATAGGKVCWNELGSCSGWRLQQNKFTKHVRILNPSDNRKAWGSYKRISQAVEHVYSRIKCDELSDLSFNQHIDADSNQIEDKLLQLKSLYDKGLINDSEFENKKKDLLKKL